MASKIEMVSEEKLTDQSNLVSRTFPFALGVGSEGRGPGNEVETKDKGKLNYVLIRFAQPNVNYFLFIPILILINITVLDGLVVQAI